MSKRLSSFSGLCNVDFCVSGLFGCSRRFLLLSGSYCLADFLVGVCFSILELSIGVSVLARELRGSFFYLLIIFFTVQEAAQGHNKKG